MLADDFHPFREMKSDSTHDDPTLLIVDDEEALADSIALWLGERYDVRVSYSGREALSAFDDAVDVVFLDRNLPGLSGDDVLDELRRQSADDLRVVLMTATPESDVSDLPADDVLTKPVTKSDLFEAAARHTVREMEATVSDTADPGVDDPAEATLD
ncbi:response regulator / transcription regulator [Haloferax larsenii JCM 13917]|nr:response regulator [Haloferax larsenii]ELZ82184.1 response regulator / transcription regulator [Haloferax larsenii JCM 13917]